MYTFWLWVLSLLGIYLMVEASPRSIKLTKILCESTDPKDIKFNQCLVQKNKENLTAAYLNVTVPHLSNLLINLRLLRQYNKKYTPFLYENSIKFCEFMRNPTTMFWGTAYKMLKPYSNINHTCPYDHEFMVAGFAFQGESDYKLFAVPRGNYILEVKLGHGVSFIGKVSVYCTMI